MALLLGLGLGLPALAQIVGSKHDLGSGGGGMWGSADTTEVCVFCHTPHHANVAEGPLWNRQSRGATYVLYASDTLESAPKQPQRETLLCLSCHDGVTALNNLVNPSGVITMPTVGDQLGDIYYPGSIAGMGANIGGSYPANPDVNDLSNDHPVSITFDATVVSQDGALRLPADGDDVRLFGPAADQLECTSCHDPHLTAFPPFLVKSNAGSQLCLTCHIK